MKRRSHSHQRVEKRRRRAVELVIGRGWTPEKAAAALRVHRRTISRYVATVISQRFSASNRCGTRKGDPDLDRYLGILPQRRAPLYAIETQNRDLFLQTLARLTARQRQTYFDYFVDNKLAREIADQEELSREAITRRIIRIRASFTEAGLPEPVPLRVGRRHRTITLPAPVVM